MKQLIIISILLFSTTVLSAQGKIGNVAYSRSYDVEKDINQNANVISVNDSSVILSAKILLNTYADELVLTYGLDKTNNSSKAANTEIDNQINDFKISLKQEGIIEDDIYIDFISQTKVYDYKLLGNKATQFLAGFQIKKNIIIRLKDVSKFDKIFTIASNLGIYDLISANHIIKDKQSIYNSLVKEAMAVIDNKKRQFSNFSLIKIIKDSIPFSENFYVVYPENNYKSYEAYESSTINYDADIIKKELNKKTTFYFEGVNSATFDKVINESTPKKEIQCIYELKIKYLLK